MKLEMALQEIISATGAKVYGLKNSENFCCTNISTDSRDNLTGAVFIALIGEKYDAHDFLTDAVKNGASALVISREDLAEKWQDTLPVLLVADTRLALLDIARLYRDKSKAKVIALTGSVGKTSTKDLISAALATKFKVCKTAKNLNNEFGVAFTLLDIAEDTDVAVIECGMDGRGQIELTSKACRPDLTIITNIGTSHIERLGSRTEIARAKAEILAGAKAGAPLLVLADDPYLLKIAAACLEERPVIFLDSNGLNERLRSILPEDAELVEGLDKEQIIAQASTCKVKSTFPEVKSGTVYRLENFRIGQTGVCFDISKAVPVQTAEKQDSKEAGTENSRQNNEQNKSLNPSNYVKIASYSLREFGPQNALNVLFATAVSDILAVDLNEVSQKFSNGLNISEGRQELIKLSGHNLLINDSYNASPESMKSAFILVDEILKNLDYQQAVFILGGINELGEYSQNLHQDVARTLARYDFAKVYLLGPEAHNMQAVLAKSAEPKELVIAEKNTDIITSLAQTHYENTVFLCKASHAFNLEEVALALQKQYGPEKLT